MSQLPATKKIDQEIEKIEVQKQKLDFAIKSLKAKRTRQIIHEIGLPKFSKKTANETIEHSAIILSYNERHQQANWTSHMLLPDIRESQLKDKNSFATDPKLNHKTATNADYKNSGFDRGHLVPRADLKWYQKAMRESFLFSNISPQKNSLNSKKWNELEQWVRNYVLRSNHSLIIVTAPWLEEDLPKIDQGSGKVSIPRYYYKVILDLEARPAQAIGFILPNNPCHEPLSAYAVAVDYIEKKVGVDFWNNLEDSLERTVEANYNFDHWSRSSNKKSVANIKTLPASERPKGSYNSTEAQEHYGQNVMICGTVASSFKNKKGKIYLNLDAPYPKQPFSINIPADVVPKFNYAPEIYLRNKAICVQGKVYEYKEKATTTIYNTHQIKLLEKKTN